MDCDAHADLQVGCVPFLELNRIFQDRLPIKAKRKTDAAGLLLNQRFVLLFLDASELAHKRRILMLDIVDLLSIREVLDQPVLLR